MAVYGSNAIKNRVKPGGDLGSNQYYYTTNTKTGEITVNRYVINRRGRNTDVEVGTIPKGGSFTPNSTTNTSEKKHWNNKQNLGAARSSALQVTRREWDGKSQPSPNTLIYGENSLSKAYDPAGASTPTTSLKNNTQAGLPRENLTSGTLEGFLGGGSSQVLVYPTSIRQTGQDYLKIEMLEFKGKSRDGIKWGNRPQRNGKGSVILPVPGGIQSTDAVQWGQDKMGPMETAMANVALAGIESFEGMGEEMKNIANQGATDPMSQDALKKTIAGAASGTGAQLLTRTTGAILNPNMELLFKDPQLRQFNFTWKLAPRSRKEAQDVISIINFFKKGMAPSKSDSNLFLKSPNTWRLAYKHRGRDHKYLNKFKECAMLNLTTQFTPDGNYATFEDGVMTAYSITLAFQELEPIFAGDYKKGQGIGY